MNIKISHARSKELANKSPKTANYLHIDLNLNLTLSQKQVSTAIFRVVKIGGELLLWLISLGVVQTTDLHYPQLSSPPDASEQTK
jgi:hypothetical protein